MSETLSVVSIEVPGNKTVVFIKIGKQFVVTLAKVDSTIFTGEHELSHHSQPRMVDVRRGTASVSKGVDDSRNCR